MTISLARAAALMRTAAASFDPVRFGVVFAGILPALLVIAQFWSDPAYAQQPGKVVEYGIYSENHKLLKKTTTIPGDRAVRFGFCFEAFVDFFDDDTYMLVESLSHPPLAGKDGGQNNGYSVPRLFKVRDGTAYGCAGYRARNAADLRPGVWKFTISDGPDDVVTQTFTIK